MQMKKIRLNLSVKISLRSAQWTSIMTGTAGLTEVQSKWVLISQPNLKWCHMIWTLENCKLSFLNAIFWLAMQSNICYFRKTGPWSWSCSSRTAFIHFLLFQTDDLFRKQVSNTLSNKPSVPKKPAHLKELAAKNKTKDGEVQQVSRLIISRISLFMTIMYCNILPLLIRFPLFTMIEVTALDKINSRSFLPI